MTAYLLANHLLNFIAPAAVVALLLVGLSRWLPLGKARARAGRSAWRQQLALVFLVQLAVLALALVLFRNDGKLLTYAAMALAGALSQWLLLRGWKA